MLSLNKNLEAAGKLNFIWPEFGYGTNKNELPIYQLMILEDLKK